ncbi:MAG: ammonia channel protein [Lentisphaerae bacterium RIFOXYB12_FULL_65_16]|nr:MAG: ammonia channel protein [Lentisphaerae bacterium RIFOXYA12_64_32]OGV88460.1 MAG: ammonia channel protein [Lentisphaerae bacterium RIFOXYB12_FULL_65_16]
MNTGDTAWVLLGAAMVMMMTPALAFFYGGLVRRKNVLSILMQCFMVLCLISVQWVLFGYSLAFGPDVHGLIGNLEWFGLNGVGAAPSSYAPTIPHTAFMAFQMMFAVITPALIVGAFAERMKFGPFCILMLLWSTLVYDPVAHWVWGGGFLGAGKMGALDFAGGTVVHINAGIAALAAALVLGKRQGYPHVMSPPHSLPLAVLGAGLLWFGWFGFNAASALSANGLAANAFVVTHTAAAVAGITWALLDWLMHKKPTTLGMITGVVAGLVAITPAAGFVTPMGAMGIGAGAALFPWMAVTYMKVKFGYDDSLDAFGVHGIGGIWGALATGLWATKSVNPAGADGLFYGNPMQFLIQIKATAITLVFSFVVTVVLFKVVDMVCSLRVSEHEERVGLDLTQHKEAGYTVIS